jgi:hypothetical protein
MEAALFSLLVLGAFMLGIAVGGIIENKRIAQNRNTEYLIEKIVETQEILLPLANKFEHCNTTRQPEGTLVDYEYRDPEETMEIPVYEKLMEEKEWLRKQKNWED